MDQQQDQQAAAGATPLSTTRHAFHETGLEVESVVSGLVLISMLGFIGMLFMACFDAGLVA